MLSAELPRFNSTGQDGPSSIYDNTHYFTVLCPVLHGHYPHSHPRRAPHLTSLITRTFPPSSSSCLLLYCIDIYIYRRAPPPLDPGLDGRSSLRHGIHGGDFANTQTYFGLLLLSIIYSRVYAQSFGLVQGLVCSPVPPFLTTYYDSSMLCTVLEVVCEVVCNVCIEICGKVVMKIKSSL